MSKIKQIIFITFIPAFFIVYLILAVFVLVLTFVFKLFGADE